MTPQNKMPKLRMSDCTSLRQLVPVQDELYWTGLRKIELVHNHIKPKLQQLF